MSAALDRCLAAIRERYAEPHRHYHGTAHLDALLRLFGQYRKQLHSAEAVRLAIFYHDAIYRPERSDNEAASAQLMLDDLHGLADPVTLARAEVLVLATRDHRVPDGCDADLVADCALFLDMDISVLGAEAVEFDRYEAGIAAEYRPFHGAEAYRTGRIAVLEHFLARERLFVSEVFVPLEVSARANLARSLRALRSVSSPPLGAERPGEVGAVSGDAVPPGSERSPPHPASPPQWGGEEKRWLTIVGIGEDGVAGLSEAAKAAIEKAAVLIGGERHLAMIPAGSAERIAWGRPFEAGLTALLARRGRPMVVLASGDPMSYGVGATLARSVPVEEMVILPAPGAFSLAAARLGWPLQQVATLSLHGRPLDRLAWHLAPGARLLALTENGAAPAEIARWLVERGWGPSRLVVLERLGGSQEGTGRSYGRSLSAKIFADLNTLAIECRPGPDAQIWSRLAGLPDEAFRHDGQLTKRAVRAVTLAALAPCGAEMLWDVGAGCGSIAIEWLRALEHGRAVAIERDPARCTLIAVNATSLGVPDLRIVEGAAPAALAGLPAPDAIFIGGGVDGALLDLCYAALNSGGRLVANAVTIEGETSLYAFRQSHGGELTPPGDRTRRGLGRPSGLARRRAGDAARLPQGGVAAMRGGVLLGQRLDYLAEGGRPWLLLVLLSLSLFPARPDQPAANRSRRSTLHPGDAPDAGDRRSGADPLSGRGAQQEAGRHLLAAIGAGRQPVEL
ncbi:MAG: precorrin-6y C5,15-methyltransferase (decarboxylating) subunit CbiE [Aliidongia sp.]